MKSNMEGKKVPNVTFRVREGSNWKNVTTDDLFKGKRVAVFSLPGAFTPTCSTSHLPRYNELFQTFKKHGVDSILCISVNDSFVMNAWQKDQRSPNIMMVPDGNGEFTEKMGMLVDKGALGFGKRSWRYSMLVEDGKIKKMFIEPEKEGDPYEVSDADTMLDYIAPGAKKEEPVVVFTKEGCPHCARAKALLESKGFVYDEVLIDRDIPPRAIRALSGEISTPQVFIGGKRIGGADQLESYFKEKAAA